MRPTQRLRDDHTVLRAKLALLQAWLSSGAEDRPSIQRLTTTIADRFQRHADREEELFRQLRAALPESAADAWLQIVADWERRRRMVTALLELFRKSQDESLDQLSACGANFASALREQITDEEQRLFPWLDERLTAWPAAQASLIQGEADTPSYALSASLQAGQRDVITTAMTVQDIERQHPFTKRIFRMFSIDSEADRDCRLDGLGWRRHVDLRALMDALNRSLEDAWPARLPDLLWESCDGIMVVDASRRIVAMNPALERLTGWRAYEAIGRYECGFLFNCQDESGCSLSRHPERCPGLKAMRCGQPVSAAEYMIKARPGGRVHVSASYTPIQFHPGGPVHSMVIVRDISARQRWQRRMVLQARLDPLTGLPNRSHVLSMLAAEIKRADRHGHSLAVALAKLDQFQQGTDCQGHPVGDALVRQMARALQAGLRSTEQLGRYGDEEFLLLLPETDATGALTAVDRIRRLALPLPGNRVRESDQAEPPPVTVSFGIAVFPDDGNDPEELLLQAGRRLDQAKGRGGDRAISGPARSAERRRLRRIAVEASMLLSPWKAAAADLVFCKATTVNVSLGGASCRVALDAPVALGQDVIWSIVVPRDEQQRVGYTQLAGHGRIVRIEEMPQGIDGSDGRALGIAFTEDVTALPTSMRNGHDQG